MFGVMLHAASFVRSLTLRGMKAKCVKKVDVMLNATGLMQRVQKLRCRQDGLNVFPPKSRKEKEQ